MRPRRLSSHRAQRMLPGATWTLYPRVGAGVETLGTEYLDGEELERTGKAEGELTATAVGAVEEKPYDEQVPTYYATKRNLHRVV